MGESRIPIADRLEFEHAMRDDYLHVDHEHMRREHLYELIGIAAAEGYSEPPNWDEVESLRTVLNDLLLTRQAHEEADENMSVLLCTEGPNAPTEDELRQASDIVGETLLAHAAAWDRARHLVGEPHERREEEG